MSEQSVTTQQNQVEQTKLTAKSLFAKDEVRAKFQELLGKRASAFMTSVLQIVSSNELLKRAEPNSVYQCAALAATLDLPLNQNLGFAYIIPYNEKAKGDKPARVVAQFQIGYKGFKQLALRSGQFLSMNATDVREGEIKQRDRLSGEITFDWIQDEDEREKAKIVGYVSFFRLLNGYEKTLFMTTKQVEKHAKRYSQSYKKNYGQWVDDFESMALKTVTKLNLSKDAPLSVDMQKAIVTDQAIITDSDTEDVQYIDNEAEEENPETKRVLLMIGDAKTLPELEALGKYVNEETGDVYTAKLDELKSTAK